MKQKQKKTVEELLETLNDSASALQEKIIESIPIYKEMPLAQEMTTTKDEVVWKNNPAMQEFRGLVRDYAAIVKQLKELNDEDEKADTDSLEGMRNRFKVIGG